jgi:hypothetical protein
MPPLRATDPSGRTLLDAREPDELWMMSAQKRLD